ncbi:MAG: hypothetical protein QNJ75_02480 [Acidimicrobiia bacterium]|nr:hypothetical protein [Acidimicrobiia bacterium]
MRLIIGLCALALVVVGCAEADDGPPDGEQFAFTDWIAGIEYAVAVEIDGDSQPADSRDFAAWSGTATTVEWQRPTTTEAGRSVAVSPPSPGDRVALTVAESVAVPSGATVIALVNDLRESDSVEHVAQLVMDSNWQPLPGSLQPAVDGLEAAAAATAISDRRGAVLAVLEDMTR